MGRRLWDLEKGDRRWRKPANAARVRFATEETIVTAGEGEARAWSRVMGEAQPLPRPEGEGPVLAAPGPAGERIAVARAGGEMVVLADPAGGTRGRLPLGAAIAPKAKRPIAWSPDGRLLAVRTRAGVGIWNARACARRRFLEPGAAGGLRWLARATLTVLGEDEITEHRLPGGELARRTSEPRADFHDVALAPETGTLRLSGTRAGAAGPVWALGPEAEALSLAREPMAYPASSVGRARLAPAGGAAAQRFGPALHLSDTETGKRRAALLPTAAGQALLVGPAGDLRGRAAARNKLVAIARAADGAQKLLSPSELRSAHGWDNEPARIRTLPAKPRPRPEPRATEQPPVTALDLEPTAPARERGAPMSRSALVRRPASLEGLHSWTWIVSAHGGEIEDVAFGPRGRLATACADGIVRLWDPDTGDLERALVGHAPPVNRLAFSPSGRYLASVGNEETRVWSIPDGRLMRKWKSSGHPHFLTWAPDGQQLIWSGHQTDGIVRVPSGKRTDWPFHSRGEVRGIAFGPRGDRLALGFMLRNNEGAAVAVLDATTLETKERFPTRAGPDGRVPIAWGPDGNTLAMLGEDGEELVLRDVGTGSVRKRAAISFRPMFFAVSRNRRRLVASTGGRDPGRKGVATWDLAENELRARPGHGRGRVAVRPGGSELALALSRRVEVFSATTLEDVRRFGEVIPSARPLSALIHNAKIAWNASGTRFTVTSGRSLALFDLTKAEIRWRIRPWPGADLRVWGSGPPLVGRYAEETGVVLDMATGKAGKAWGRRVDARHPKRDLIATAEDEGKRVRIWSATSGETETVLELDAPVHTRGQGWQPRLKWSPGGEWLAIMQTDGLAFWEWRANERRGVYGNEPAGILRTWVDEKILAISADGKIALIEAPAGTPRKSVPAKWTLDLSLSENNDRLVAIKRTDNTFLVHLPLDGRDGKRVKRLPGRKNDVPDNGGHFTSGGRRGVVVTGRAAHVFRATDGEPRGVLRFAINGEEAGAVAVSPKGHFKRSGEKRIPLVAVGLTEDGEQVILTPEVLAARYGWENDPSKVSLLPEPPGRPETRPAP